MVEKTKVASARTWACSVLGVAVAIAAACGSSDERASSDADADAGNDSGGESSSAAGSSSRGGADASGGAPQAGEGGISGDRGDPSNGGANGGVVGNDDGGAAGAAGLAGSAGSSGFVPDPVIVDSYGCFFRSGDGGDVLASGEPATVVTSSPHSAACGVSWVSDNANAYSPQQTPTTISLQRAFVLDPSIANGSVSISFKADDAVDFVLNGDSIALCTPSEGNPGECQASCKKFFIASELLLGEGQTNTLEIQLINLNSVAAGGGNFGWTAVSYEVCVTPPS